MHILKSSIEVPTVKRIKKRSSNDCRSISAANTTRRNSGIHYIYKIYSIVDSVDGRLLTVNRRSGLDALLP